MSDLIDLDNNATTPVLRAVRDAMMDALAPTIANPSSSHRHGRAARAMIESARIDVAAMAGFDPEQVIFTSGATEGNDAVLRHYRGRLLVTMAGAHPSLVGGHDGPKRLGSIDREGRLDLEAYESVLREEGSCVVALAMVNGETGVTQPVAEICEISKRHGAVILIDTAQAVGRVPADWFDFEADYLTFSAHKMNGPKGIGCLIVGSGASIPHLASGGGQERGRRSGTENVPGIAGFGAACRKRLENLDADIARMADLRDRLEGHIQAKLPFAWINAQKSPRAATTTSLTVPGVDGMALIARLDAMGVLCSQISACSSGRPEPSATLMAMGLSEKDAFSTIRLSVSVQTSTSDIDRAAEIIVQEALFLNGIMGGAA
ncbi:cysteine desulfurase family protein [Loktanella sp. DJP18]|uniref:cysteine desulfurase family protein n=1 Tax=Loktanella sp. DJP18 TaxID=3409788 RepID=UPI003BB77DB4